jgi:hypothetical protein
MSSIPRPIPTTLFGLPPLGAFFSAFGPAKKKQAPARAARAVKPAGTWPTPPAPDPEGVDMIKLLAAVKVAPELSLIEWDGDRSRSAAAPAPLEFTANEGEADDRGEVPPGMDFDAAHLDPRRRKIRERYIAARFPGVARTIGDLHSADRVIKAARLYFEDDQPELALELLELAAQETPHESPVWLAHLEILFLMRDAGGFVAASRAFRQVHGAHDAWPEIERLGRALVPGEALFGQTSGPREHEHYGPWPHTPNWIQAPWDLTPEIAAADFRRAAMRIAGRVNA